jgi:hypothetical protein
MLRCIDRTGLEGKYVAPYLRAIIYAGLGDTNQALTELEKSLEENSIWLIWLNIDLHFKSLHNEPRFKDLLKELNFPV